MRSLVTGSLVMVSVVATACTGGSPAVTASPSGASATATATAAGQTSFMSTTYGYSLTLPAGWTGVQASQAWDGTSAISSDSPQVDQFHSLSDAGATGVAAPVSQALPAHLGRDNGDSARSRRHLSVTA